MMKQLLYGVAASTLLLGSAQAADLGGNCCADLEERVAELEATTARKGNRKVTLEVSGHVNAAVITTDLNLGIDGDDMDDVRIIDNDNSESRFRFKGAAKLSPDWEAGFLMEFGIGDVINDGSDIGIRHAALYLKVKQLGTVWLGKTSEATDGIMEISLAPSEPGTLTSLAPFDERAQKVTGVLVTNPFDGGRTQTISFISETFAGFQIRGSWNEDENWSAALRYALEAGPMRFAAGIGYRDEMVVPDVGPVGTRQFWGGSASLMHTPTGLFVDGAYGNSNGLQTITFGAPGLGVTPIGDGRLELYAGRGGISKAFSALGKTTFYGEYGQLRIEGSSSDPYYWGLGIQQDVDAGAVSLYAGWRQYDLDDLLGPGDDNVNTFIGGAKIRF